MQRARALGLTTVTFRPSLEGVLETELGNGWMVVESFEIHDGRRVVAELRICPAPPQTGAHPVRMYGDRSEDDAVPAGGLRARLLRMVKVGKYAEPVISDYRHWIKKQFGPDALARLDAHTGRPSRRRRSKKPRTRRATDVFYAKLAKDYETLWQRGVKAPTAMLATMRSIPPEKMRSHVHLARTNGFLTETSRGRAGGILTGKGHDTLQQIATEDVTGEQKTPQV